jgi:hypothetical protein
MNQPALNESSNTNPPLPDDAAPPGPGSELSQDELASANGGTFVDDLIKAIQNR